MKNYPATTLYIVTEDLRIKLIIAFELLLDILCIAITVIGMCYLNVSSVWLCLEKEY